MNILFLSDNFPPEVNATASRVYERARYWVKWGHQVTVITSAPNFPQGKIYAGYKNRWIQKEIIEGIHVIRVKTFMAENKGFALRVCDFLSYMLMAIIVGIFEKKPSLIVATSPQFFAGIGGYILSIFKRTPFVLEVSDLWPASIAAVGSLKKESFTYRMIEKIELFIYGKASRIILLTDSFKKDLLARGILAKKLDVVINGVELSQYHPQEKSLELLDSLKLQKKFVIGYIGTHGMAHDLSHVLTVAEKLNSTIPQIHFLFVGDGAEKKSLLEKAKKLQLKNVTFIDPQPKSLIAKYWSLCDVALIHLKNDATFKTVIPSKLFEAMAMELPILLVAPKGEASDIVQRERCGVFILAESTKDFCEAAIELMENKDFYNELKSNSLHAAPRYSREKQAENYLKSLQNF